MSTMDITSTTTSSASSSSSSISNFYSTSTMTGLVDGINVDSIVSGLMTAARVPEDALDQQVQTLQWQQQDYQTINTDLQSLQITVSSLELQGTFLTMQASSSSSAVTATAGTSALIRQPHGLRNLAGHQRQYDLGLADHRLHPERQSHRSRPMPNTSSVTNSDAHRWPYIYPQRRHQQPGIQHRSQHQTLTT